MLWFCAEVMKYAYMHACTHTHSIIDHHTEPNYRCIYAVCKIYITCVCIHNIEFAIYFVQAWKAFGNYLDLLKEVTFSPLMGEYLSFLRNSAFDHDQNYPDENYAREVYLGDGRHWEGFVLAFIGMM